MPGPKIILKLSFFYYSKAEHERVKRSLRARFDKAPSVPQIQKSHSFTVLGENKLLIKRFLNANHGTTVRY